jgi:Predicted glycosyltransferase
MPDGPVCCTADFPGGHGMLLKVGEGLILEKEGEDRTAERFRCRIADLKENQILIDYPIDERTGKTALFLNETLLMANYVMDNHVFRFRVEFVRRVPGRIPMMLLRYEGEAGLEQVQRRNYVRVDANLDVAVHSKDESFSPFVTLTSDVGGGGVLIYLPEDVSLRPASSVTIWLCIHLENGISHYLMLEGNVVRVFQDKLSHKNKASIEFRLDNEAARQPIIRFCFNKQLESRRKILQWELDHRRH